MFDNHFEVFLADTEESKNIHYNIRYQVYCEEMGFENGKDFPEQMEYDDDDAKSIHFIVRDTATKQWVGATRLIYKRDGKMPIEDSCVIDEEIDRNDFFETVEISRLCLIKDVRRGKDIDPPHGIVDTSDQKTATSGLVELPSQNKLNRLIIWGMFHAISEYCFNNRINFCYFMTTSILAKVMARGGLDLISIGAPCEFRGTRFPFKIDAIAAFQSEMWKNDFNNSYLLYSIFEKQQSLSAA